MPDTYRCTRCHNQAQVAHPTLNVPGTQAPVLVTLTNTVTCTACGLPMQPDTPRPRHHNPMPATPPADVIATPLLG